MDVAVETGISIDTIRRIEQKTERGEQIRVARRTWQRLCDVYAVTELTGVEQRA